MWWAVANRRYRYSEYIKNLWDNIRCPPIITKGKGAGRDAHTEYSINWSKTGPKAQSKEQHLKNGTGVVARHQIANIFASLFKINTRIHNKKFSNVRLVIDINIIMSFFNILQTNKCRGLEIYYAAFNYMDSNEYKEAKSIKTFEMTTEQVEAKQKADEISSVIKEMEIENAAIKEKINTFNTY